MNKKILVVEDLEMLRELIRKMILSLGFDVFVAADGQEALVMIEAIKPDLILSDIEMPRLDGIGLVLKTPSSIPIILMTGNPDKNIPRLVEIENAGRKVPHVLRKPFSHMELGLTLIEALK